MVLMAQFDDNTSMVSSQPIQMIPSMSLPTRPKETKERRSRTRRFRTLNGALSPVELQYKTLLASMMSVYCRSQQSIQSRRHHTEVTRGRVRTTDVPSRVEMLEVEWTDTDAQCQKQQTYYVQEAQLDDELQPDLLRLPEAVIDWSQVYMTYTEEYKTRSMVVDLMRE